MTTPSTLLDTALAAAEAAARVHRQAGRNRTAVERREKGRADFVSEVDLEAQRVSLAVIRERYPEHEILAEEEDGKSLGASDDRAHESTPAEGYLWIVDPLDGTANFLHRHPMYCASVAVARGDRLLAGAVVAAETGERWYAAADSGAFKDRAFELAEDRRESNSPTPLSVSTEPSLRMALVGTGFPFKALDRLPDYLAQFEAVLRSASGIRRGGSAALDLCYLAQGSLDVFWEAILSPWDVAAGLLILEEAGGMATRIDGSPIDLEPGPILAANSPILHEALADVLESAGRTGPIA